MSMTTDPTETLARCAACGATAAADQRYCLSCGTRREDVPDPVSAYLSEAGAARARVAAALQRQKQARQVRRLPRVSPVLTAALVAVALLVGLEIGQSSSGSGSAKSAVAASTARTGSGAARSNATGSAVAKVQSSKGQSYVQQQNNLPTSVTP